jgi:hypothetical protein
LGIGIGIVVITTVLFLIDRPRAGVAAILILFVPYLAFMAPFHCREMTTRRTACTRSRWGWLIGCHDHRWFALRRIFGRQMSPRMPMRVPAPRPGTAVMGSGPATSGSPGWSGNSRVYDGVTLVVALVSAVAGVLALLPGFG